MGVQTRSRDTSHTSTTLGAAARIETPAAPENPSIEEAPACLSTPKRLLIVDDDPAVFALLRTHLAPLGYQLTAAEDEQAALALFAVEAPDLVLLDLMMPGIGGLGILAHIRGDARGLYVPVIFITAHAERSLRLLALRAGADEFLEKPIDAPILLARVTTLLNLKESRDQLQTARDTLTIRNGMLETLQRQQRELLQFVVHDLKNQLFVVLMSLEYAEARTSAHDYHQLPAVLHDGRLGAEKLRTMVEDLLAVSRLEDAFPVQVQLISVSGLLDSVVDGYRATAKQNAIALTGPLDADWTLRADPALLRRVVENILDNALRYTPTGGRIAVSATRAERIEIVISNDGPAVPVDERQSIFEKFVRGRCESSTIGNSGLGLYFCKRAMEAHGGSISVYETKEWPTSFALSFVGPV